MLLLFIYFIIHDINFCNIMLYNYNYYICVFHCTCFMVCTRYYYYYYCLSVDLFTINVYHDRIVFCEYNPICVLCYMMIQMTKNY